MFVSKLDPNPSLVGLREVVKNNALNAQNGEGIACLYVNLNVNRKMYEIVSMYLS